MVKCEAGRVQIRRKGLNARFLIRNKAQSPRILDQVAQFISHWKTVSDGSAIDYSICTYAGETEVNFDPCWFWQYVEGRPLALIG